MQAVTVWWASPRDAADWHVGLLDAAERERRERYVHAADRDRFAVGVALTRLVMAERLGVSPRRVPLDRSCADCGRPHGAPRLPDGGPWRSISHSADRVALAVSPDGPVGVDVEAATRRLDAGLARQVLAAGELAAIELPADEPAADGPAVGGGEAPGGEPASVERSTGRGTLDPERLSARLLDYWTRKEAIVKATGEGLRVAFPDLTVSGPGEPPRLLAWSGRPGFAERVSLHTLRPGPDYAACLALIDQPAAEVREEQGRPLLNDRGR